MRHALQDGQLAGVAIERKRLIDSCNLRLTQPQRARSRIVGRMVGGGCFGDGKEWGSPHQERQRNLAQGRVMRGSNLREHAATRSSEARQVTLVTEGAVADYRDPVPVAPGQDGVLDRALLQVIEDLIQAGCPWPAIPRTSSRSDTSKLLTPQLRILPCRCSSSKPAMVSWSG